MNIRHTTCSSLLDGTICTAFFLLTAVPAMAQTPVLTESVKLNSATVFLRGAELFGSANVSLPAGESEVILENIAANFNRQSLSLSASNGAQILSFNIKDRDPGEEKALPPAAEALQSQLKEAGRERENIQLRIAIHDRILAEQTKIIEENRRLGSDKAGVSSSELADVLTLVERKISQLLQDQAENSLALSEIDKRIASLQWQFEQERLKALQPGGRIAIKLNAPRAVTSTIAVSYVIYDAGWMPTYDLRAKAVNEPVTLVYKADVFQSSSINWNNVRLTLSTGNPSRGAQAPTLSPWHIGLEHKYARALGAAMYDRSDMVAAEAIPAAPAAPEPRMQAVKAAPRPEVQAMNDYVVTRADGISTDYEIALPYSIPADGKGHMVLVKSVDLTGAYRYVATPKLDKDAFLQVRIKRDDLDLLSGKSAIYYGNSYVGEGMLNTSAADEETLDISLGRDKKIIVSRENDKNFKEKPSFFGGNIDKSYAYTINVRNVRAEQADVSVFDQIPVSTDSDVKVLDIRHEGAEYDKDSGKLEWKLTLEPGEARTLRFSYTVRYPKDRNAANL